MKPVLRRTHLWLLIALLYFSQGIPLGLAMEALPALLRREGASLASLAFLPLVGLPWVLKFLWASRVDNCWSAKLGRRRTWILPMQATVLLCLATAAALDMASGTAPWIVALAAIGSLASATQDIATDGLTAEHFEGAALARANALQVGGTMVGFFFGGSGCLVMIGLFGQHAALTVLAAVAGASLLLAAVWREDAPDALQAREPASLAGFVRRPGALLLLCIALLSAMTAAAGYGLSKLLLVDAGWPLDAVGRVGMAGGMVTVVLGCGGGAWLVGRLGSHTIFVAGVAISALASALWLGLSTLGPALPAVWVWLATALGCFGAGATSVAVMTMAMAFARRGAQAGTDITAVQSTRDLGEVATSSTVTGIAAHLGYAGGFATGLASAIAALAVALILQRREQRSAKHARWVRES
ncbi:RhtX/FptX family siderophore transporter [Candidimonas nitroreducens]|uniref:MFS transporter n=1 Tax=Candidimonas nitroreducens TaxID=683354 RepID=A0A225MYS8_9BURK|nr:RhtX/FptX family siderophore transporter [Candidimonas nitroreducens]OWT66274.1 MFS transporter [Candidimonas nitroreducens]